MRRASASTRQRPTSSPSSVSANVAASADIRGIADIAFIATLQQAEAAGDLPSDDRKDAAAAWERVGDNPGTRAELGDQVALLELKRGQDVGGVCERKQKVADGHLGRGPEREQKAEHDGMAHDLVEQRCSERLTWYLAPAERDEGLAQAEQIEMIDHVGRGERDKPAKPMHADQQPGRYSARLPDR